MLHNSESRLSSPGQRRSWGGHWVGISCVSNIQKTRVEVFACLGSSHGFLSTIFGILRKFWVDIGKNLFQKIIFKTKKISRKNEVEIFQIFSDQKIEILKNQKIENFDHWICFKMSTISNFWFFKILIFLIRKNPKFWFYVDLWFLAAVFGFIVFGFMVISKGLVAQKDFLHDFFDGLWRFLRNHHKPPKKSRKKSFFK